MSNLIKHKESDAGAQSEAKRNADRDRQRREVMAAATQLSGRLGTARANREGDTIAGQSIRI